MTQTLVNVLSANVTAGLLNPALLLSQFGTRTIIYSGARQILAHLTWRTAAFHMVSPTCNAVVEMDKHLSFIMQTMRCVAKMEVQRHLAVNAKMYYLPPSLDL